METGSSTLLFGIEIQPNQYIVICIETNPLRRLLQHNASVFFFKFRVSKFLLNELFSFKYCISIFLRTLKIGVVE